MTNRYIIYQLKHEENLHLYRFENYSSLVKDGHQVELQNYDKVYEAALLPSTTLDDIYFTFNVNHPSDFFGHSLSVSDIIVFRKDGEAHAYYVDSFGFKEVPEFLNS